MFALEPDFPLQQAPSSAPALRVTLSESHGGYRSYVVAGLVELAAAGALRLSHGHLGELPNHPDVGDAGMWMQVESLSGETVRVFFDLTDYPEFARLDDVKSADVYFKRSYLASAVSELPPQLARKVSPMTIQYGCRSRQEGRVLRVHRQAATFSLRRGPHKALRRVIGAAVRSDASAGQFIDNFEVAPDVPAASTVYLRTRLYKEPTHGDEARRAHIADLNAFRVRLIEALKEGLGPRFVGGLYPTAATLRMRPDLIDDVPEGRENFQGHLARSHASVINVSQAGVRGSTGWKLPECLAASRCLVSQAPIYQNLDEVQAGRHFAAYQTPEQCVEVCLELLADPQLAAGYRQTGFQFYQKFIRPHAAMVRLIQEALTIAGKV